MNAQGFPVIGILLIKMFGIDAFDGRDNFLSSHYCFPIFKKASLKCPLARLLFLHQFISNRIAPEIQDAGAFLFILAVMPTDCPAVMDMVLSKTNLTEVST
jgi:hypothetical protein